MQLHANWQKKIHKDRPKEPTCIRSLCRVSLKQSQGLLSANWKRRTTQDRVYFNSECKHHKIISFFTSISLHHLKDYSVYNTAGRPSLGPMNSPCRVAPQWLESVKKTGPLFTSYTIFFPHKKKLFITHGAKQRRLHMTSFHINISFV